MFRQGSNRGIPSKTTTSSTKSVWFFFLCILIHFAFIDVSASIIPISNGLQKEDHPNLHPIPEFSEPGTIDPNSSSISAKVRFIHASN